MEKLVSFVDSSFKTKEPAFCVKTHIEGNETKFFINFCHSNSISPPIVHLNENDLQALIEKENYEELSKFSIPLVLEEVEITTDKKGNRAKVTHAIMNTKFYHENLSSSDIYKRFLIYITIETVNAKFNIKLNQTSCVILKNKHFQLPDNRNTFNKFINSYDTSKILSTSDDNRNEQIKSIEVSQIEVPESVNPNVRISLDLKLDNIEIAIKFDDKIIYDNLILLLNEDQVMVKHKDKVVNNFYLPILMKVDQAGASFKANILRIKCPVCL